MNWEKNQAPAHEEDAFVSHESNFSHLMNSIVVPRPIALVTSKGKKGVINAAPFSYFSVVSKNPPLISLSIHKRNGEDKDTSRNILTLKEFVINICSPSLANAVAIAGSDFPPDVSEIDVAKLTLIPSHQIEVPRIANTLIQMECLLFQHVPIQEGFGDLIVGKVVKVHLHKDILNTQGNIDIQKLNPLARLAGPTYARVTDFFDVKIF